MEESTLRWPTDKEREEMEEVCSIGEVPHVSILRCPTVVFVIRSLFISSKERNHCRHLTSVPRNPRDVENIVACLLSSGSHGGWIS